MLSNCFTCRLFDLIFEVIVAAIYRNLMSVYSGCLNFCNGSYASLCIINVPRDLIVKNILHINGTIQKNHQNNQNLEDQHEWNKCNKVVTRTKHILRCHKDTITSLKALIHGGRLQISHSDYLWRMLRQISAWGPFSEITFTSCWSGLVVGYNQNVCIESVLIKVQNWLQYHH